MRKMCAAQLVVLLLALQLISSQVVRAQNTIDAPKSNYNMTPTALVNVTSKNGCGGLDTFMLLLPLALAASLLHGWSQ